MVSTLVTVSVLHWLVLVTPGANVLVVSQLAASGQRKAALCAAGGVTSVALIWSVLAVLGVHAIFAAHHYLRMMLQLAGGGYLCYVAIRLWRSGSQQTQAHRTAMNSAAAFRLGFLTNIMNPKSALFFGSVFASALPASPSSTLLVAVVGMVFVNALVWHAVLALTFSQARVQRAYGRYRGRLNRIAAIVVAVFGLRLQWGALRGV